MGIRAGISVAVAIRRLCVGGLKPSDTPTQVSPLLVQKPPVAIGT